MGVKSVLKYLFTWWNGTTVGTNVFTFFKGKKVGEDYLGNSYYQSKDQEKRWCIYCDQSEASRISPDWNSWLRFISNTVPESNEITYEWQKVYKGNVTGLDNAYKPRTIRVGRLTEDLDGYKSDYKAWKPE